MSKLLTHPKQQIAQFHATLVCSVVAASNDQSLLPQLEPTLGMLAKKGWATLVSAIRAVINGKRDASVLLGLDDEDRAIIETILCGIQDSSTLPDPDVRPAASAAAPALANMVDAAARGNPAAKHALANIVDQMIRTGGDMARLGSILRKVVSGERSADKLANGMTAQGRELVYAILSELGQLASH